MSHKTVLDVQNFSLSFAQQHSPVVKNINIQIHAGETLGLAGASGSGKSLTARAIMGLLPDACRTVGRIVFNGNSLDNTHNQNWSNLRGRCMALVFQEPMTALNPVQTVGWQITEMLVLHSPLSRSKRHHKMQEILQEVQLDANFSYRYPHQLSGGQKQRVVIAMAVACRPALLICDEPTTALDVTTQAKLIQLLKSLQKKHHMGMLFISHDLAVMASVADRIAVMQEGQIVETNTTVSVINQPRTDYTQRLLAAAGLKKSAHLDAPQNQTPLLEVNNLTVRFKQRSRLFQNRHITAVNQANISIHPGEIIGLVGESGSGKTTLGRCLVGLQTFASGDIRLKGRQLGHDRATKKSIQMIFQDPYASLNPQLTIRQSISEPLDLYRLHPGQVQRRLHLKQLLSQVGLDETALSRYPHQFSGGQRQRLAIARAMACEPALLICDEAVTALDVLVQQQVLALLARWVRETELSVLFISHDIALVSGFAHRIAVMQDGRLVEQGLTRDILHHPQQSYTQHLINSVPRLNPSLTH